MFKNNDSIHNNTKLQWNVNWIAQDFIICAPTNKILVIVNSIVLSHVLSHVTYSQIFNWRHEEWNAGFYD